MKIVTIVGARPQFVKAAVVSRAIENYNRNNNSKVDEILVHTGQHYDHGMSQVFFDELKIPTPAYNLGIGSGGHGEQTGKMLAAIEDVIVKEKPDALLIYGDTNSTLAGALAAAKLHIPVGHVEAGLRSYDRRMPEEVNRVLSDHISNWLFCPTDAAIENLNKEGITEGIHCVGDVMYDASLFYSTLAEKNMSTLTELGLTPKKYFLATVHRAENTDHPERLGSIFSAFSKIDGTIVLPLHPRARKLLNQYGIFGKISKNVKIIEPVSYLNMVVLEKNAKAILTDSGGVQKEAYFYGVPCITLRDRTEWVETVASNANFIVDVDENKILTALQSIGQAKFQDDLYGDGHSGDKTVAILAGKPF